MPSMEELIMKMSHMLVHAYAHTQKYYSAMRKKEILPFEPV